MEFEEATPVRRPNPDEFGAIESELSFLTEIGCVSFQSNQAVAVPRPSTEKDRTLVGRSVSSTPELAAQGALHYLQGDKITEIPGRSHILPDTVKNRPKQGAIFSSKDSLYLHVNQLRLKYAKNIQISDILHKIGISDQLE